MSRQSKETPKATDWKPCPADVVTEAAAHELGHVIGHIVTESYFDSAWVAGVSVDADDKNITVKIPDGIIPPVTSPEVWKKDVTTVIDAFKKSVEATVNDFGKTIEANDIGHVVKNYPTTSEVTDAFDALAATVLVTSQFLDGGVSGSLQYCSDSLLIQSSLEKRNYEKGGFP